MRSAGATRLDWRVIGVLVVRVLPLTEVVTAGSLLPLLAT
jgi:hypothetical protein